MRSSDSDRHLLSTSNTACQAEGFETTRGQQLQRLRSTHRGCSPRPSSSPHSKSALWHAARGPAQRNAAYKSRRETGLPLPAVRAKVSNRAEAQLSWGVSCGHFRAKASPPRPMRGGTDGRTTGRQLRGLAHKAKYANGVVGQNHVSASWAARESATRIYAAMLRMVNPNTFC